MLRKTVYIPSGRFLYHPFLLPYSTFIFFIQNSAYFTYIASLYLTLLYEISSILMI